LMSVMRVLSVSGFLTNSFLSNLLLCTTPFSILPFVYFSPLSSAHPPPLLLSLPVPSPGAFQSCADYFIWNPKQCEFRELLLDSGACGSRVVKILCCKPEGRGFEIQGGELVFSIYLILPAALDPGVH
jgi:hypothetical protein